jgi:hypothetical protein
VKRQLPAQRAARASRRREAYNNPTKVSVLRESDGGDSRRQLLILPAGPPKFADCRNLYITTRAEVAHEARVPKRKSRARGVMLTPEQRSEAASKASLARWARKRKPK